MIKPEIPFIEFPSIARLAREAIATEKLDGTNAQVYIDDLGVSIHAGSRSRWITPDEDNFGFARWVDENAAELIKLGPGSHFGEWWGPGINKRGYKIPGSLFNTERWGDDATRPACCHVVPVLWRGMFDELDVHTICTKLKEGGSVAAPGTMNPEGIVVFHTKSRQLYKFTLDSNDKHKWETQP